MPIITGLRVQRKGRDRVSLYLDDAFAFDLPLVCAAGLHTGQALSQADVKALDDQRQQNAAYERAVNYLSYRSRSCQEVRRHLAKSGIPPAIAEVVLERLRRQGAVDDAAFARFWIENRERFKPMAPRALRYELRQKGVSEDIIASLLESIDAEASAARAAQKHIWRFRGETRGEFRRKLSSRLYRRGFDHDAIRCALDRLEAELDDSDPSYFADGQGTAPR